MDLIPNVITHNYDPARGIGRNICNLPPDQAEGVLEEIRASGTRKIKSNYLSRPMVVKDWLIAERERLLEKTPMSRPIYCFLGNFADGKDLSRPASLVMPFDAFPAEALTFTYPDSMASLPIATKEDHLVHRKEYHGQVLTLAEIKTVVAQYGLPGDRWMHDPTMIYDRFIEVQVWDDAPMKQFVDAL